MRFMDAGMPTPPGIDSNPSAWTGTRDYSSSVWGPSYNCGVNPASGAMPARVLDSQGGKLFFDYFATVPGAAPYLAVVTWNDYDEGTQIEDFFAMLSGIRIGS
jgi:hypothetical protein